MACERGLNRLDTLCHAVITVCHRGSWAHHSQSHRLVACTFQSIQKHWNGYMFIFKPRAPEDGGSVLSPFLSLSLFPIIPCMQFSRFLCLAAVKRDVTSHEGRPHRLLRSGRLRLTSSSETPRFDNKNNRATLSHRFCLKKE